MRRLGVLLAACLLMGAWLSPSTSSAQPAPRGLVLYSGLESAADIMADGGIFNGGSFVPGISGMAYSVDYTVTSPLVTFPASFVNWERGTIEFWGKLTNPHDTPFSNGAVPGFVWLKSAGQLWALSITGNNGHGQGGIVGAAGASTNQAATSGHRGHDPYTGLLGDGAVEAWHHYALVWDRSGNIPGLPATATVGVFVDGGLDSTTWTFNNAFAPIAGGQLGLLHMTHSFGKVTQGSYAIDELRIWDTVVTSFAPACLGIATLTGTDLADVIVGSAQSDVIAGAGGDDIIYGGGGNDIICGGDGNDVLYGGPGADSLLGQAGDDELDGSWGTDTLYGDVGDDILRGDQNDDYLHGGHGTDMASYIHAAGPEVIDLITGMASGADGNDTLVAIEDLTGSSWNDILRGDAMPNTFLAGPGDDILEGRGGDDRLFGKSGFDVISGQTGNDHLDGGPDSDLLRGQTGDDLIVGGQGWDTVSYLSAAGPVNVDLRSGGVTGADGVDQIYSVESVAGSNFDDLIRGNAGDNELRGAGGDDTLIGGRAGDRLIGGAGIDEADGGMGSDFCRAEIRRNCEL